MLFAAGVACFFRSGPGVDATLDIIQPLVAGVLVGVITWLLTGLFGDSDASAMTDD